MRYAFAEFDLNRDGRISRRNFQQACAHLGLTLAQDELQLLLEHFDASGQDTVDYGAFCAFATTDGDEMGAINAKLRARLATLIREGFDPGGVGAERR